MPALPIRKIIRLRYNLDIPGFIRAALRYNLNREQVLSYLEIIVTSTREAIERMGHFVPIAKHEGPHPQRDSRMALSLLWRTDRPGASQQKLCIPLGCAENVLAGLEEKGIIEDDRVL